MNNNFGYLQISPNHQNITRITPKGSYPQRKHYHAGGIQYLLENLRKVGLSEEAIADYIGVHQSTISRIINGVIKRPRPEIISKVRELYAQHGKG